MQRPRLRRPPSPPVGDDPPAHDRVVGLDDDDLPQNVNAMVCMWPHGPVAPVTHAPNTREQRVVHRNGSVYRLLLVNPSGAMNVRASARFEMDLRGKVIVKKVL